MGKIKDFFTRGEALAKTRQPLTLIKMIADYNNALLFENTLYKSDIVRACIRPKSKAIGKLVATHIRKGSDGKHQINPDTRIKFLLEEPNPLMSGQELQEKMINQLELNGNAFAYVKRDASNRAIAIYPISSTMVSVYNGKQTDEKILKFELADGKMLTVAYADVIHLRKDFTDDDFFGESPQQALLPLLEVIGTYDQSMIYAIKNSAIVKWLLRFSSSLAPEDIEKETKRFADTFLKVNDKGGAIASSSQFEVEQVKPQNYLPEEDKISNQQKRILLFFNTNEKIVRDCY